MSSAVAAPDLPTLLERAATTPAGVSIVDRALDGARIPYSELAERAATGAAVLRAHGVKPGDRVCLLSSTSPEFLVGLWATWWAGAAPVVLPLPRRQPDSSEYLDEVTGRLRHAGAALLLVADQLEPLLDALDVGVEVLPLSALESGGHAAAAPSRDGELALLQFTSGTTARSRAVALSPDKVMANITADGAALEFSADDTMVIWLPFYHDMGIISMLVTVAHGAELVLLPPEEFLARPGAWMDAISRFRGSITVAPNMGYALAVRDLRMRPRDLDLSNLKVAGNGAEPIDGATFRSFHEQGERYGLAEAALCPMYGMAETTLAISMSRPGRAMHEVWVDRDGLEAERAVREVAADAEGARRLVRCGPPIPGTEVEVRNDAGEPVGTGQSGELWVRSPSLMAGYWGEPEATAEVLRDGWLRTGDLGFLHGGEVVICGRLKDVIQVGGRNLYPEDYEQLVSAVPGVRAGNVIAFGLVHAERMVVVAETKLPDGEAEQVAREAMERVTRGLSRAPEQVVLVPPGTLPKTSSGKIRRGACRERYQSGALPELAVAGRR